MGVCGLSSGRPCPFALRVWQAWADRWPPLSIPLQSNTVTGFSSAVDLATASQQSRLALGLLNRRVMKSSAAHMIIKALTLGGLSEPYPPPSSPICHSHSKSLMRIVIRYIALLKTAIVLHKENYNFMGFSVFILIFCAAFLRISWNLFPIQLLLSQHACHSKNTQNKSHYTKLNQNGHTTIGADNH